MCFLAAMMEDWCQKQAVTPVLVKITIQKYRVFRISVQDQLRRQCGPPDRLAVLDRDAGCLHLEPNGVPRLLTDPAVFEKIQMTTFFLRICPETGKDRGTLPNRQPPGLFISIRCHWGRERRIFLRLVHARFDLF